MSYVKSFVVLLEKDVSEEYAERMKQSIEMMRYVHKVVPTECTHEDYDNRERIKWELRNELWAVLHGKDKK